jgi:hypothetical protein
MSEMWTCASCGHAFRWRNQWHSCVVVDADEHLAGKPTEVIDLYRTLDSEALALGPDVVREVVKGSIAYRSRMRFAGVHVQQKGLRCAVILPRINPDPRFVRIESPMPTQHVHRFRIDRPNDLDDEVLGWLREAYAFGSG